MIKFIKEIFSFENFKKAMLYSLSSRPNLTTDDYKNLTNILKDIDQKDINEEKQIKKAA